MLHLLNIEKHVAKSIKCSSNYEQLIFFNSKFLKNEVKYTDVQNLRSNGKMLILGRKNPALLVEFL